MGITESQTVPQETLAKPETEAYTSDGSDGGLDRYLYFRWASSLLSCASRQCSLSLPPSLTFPLLLPSHPPWLPTSLLHSCAIWLFHISHNVQPLPFSRPLLPLIPLTSISRFPNLGSSQSSHCPDWCCIFLPQDSSSTQTSDWWQGLRGHAYGGKKAQMCLWF